MRGKHSESIEDYIERRRVLEAHLPAYSKTANTVYFGYVRPGLKFLVAHGPFEGSYTSGVKILNFRLEYDPKHFLPTSVIRRTLGNKPITYTMEDVRFVSQSTLMFEIYLKGPPDKKWRDDDGGLLMISRDTGQIRFYPPETDVDGVTRGLLRGSISAIWGFAKGLAGEAENAIRKPTGRWVIDKDFIDLQREMNLRIPNESQQPPRLPE